MSAMDFGLTSQLPLVSAASQVPFEQAMMGSEASQIDYQSLPHFFRSIASMTPEALSQSLGAFVRLIWRCDLHPAQQVEVDCRLTLILHQHRWVASQFRQQIVFPHQHQSDDSLVVRNQYWCRALTLCKAILKKSNSSVSSPAAFSPGSIPCGV
jgi:hypothetical protein